MLNFPQEEEKILKYWQEDDTFAKTLAKDSPQGEYVFYDGPPFATGTPHYGHIVASIMKDVVPRYQTMKGYHVDRKWGWDTHGLPIENLVEAELDLKEKKDIEKLGIDKFNEACRAVVLRYADEWRNFIPRIGRWVDMDNDYKTMDLSFMESIWWVFKTLYDKGLIYEGYKSMHICPRCETTLSNFEVTQGYKDIKDISITAKFELVDEPGTYIVAWTTTPWTLPGNVALAVGEDIKYVKVAIAEESFILAKELIEKILKDKEYKIINEFKGKDLIGKKYRPLFDYYASNSNLENLANGWQVYAADFVTTEDGTGIVHIAPAFGEDDMNLGNQYNLPFVQHVSSSGHFTEEVKDFAGLEVKPKEDVQKTDIEILKYLAGKNLLFAKQKYDHSYPHCWRCDSPLLNYATSSWFVKVTAIKDKMIANNQKINWQPEHIKDGRFGKWLEGARDWAISRQRYWGAPLPIWKNNKGDIRCIGSIAELEKLSGKKIDDLHRPMIDEVAWSDEQGKWQRIPDVLDCWFESGSMPYAQFHYPFANTKEFDNLFPGEFIAEGQDQTRGWFYTLMVLATALFDKPAFKNVIVNGIVLAEDGNKMSKRLKNYPDPLEVVNKYGADSLRYYLLTSPVMKATDLRFVAKDVADIYRNLIMMTINIVNFYKMYADKAELDDESNELDQWLNIRLQQTLETVTANMDKYKLVEAARPLMTMVNDFSTWYIRRSRDRFKDGSKSAINTTKEALELLAKIMAPFIPFMAEWVYQQLGYKTSVHMENWPILKNLSSVEQAVLDKMAEVHNIVEKALAARDEVGIKVRQPLNKLKAKSTKLKAEDINYIDLIKDEVNVKMVEIDDSFVDDIELDTNISDELKKEGVVRDLVRHINGLRKKTGLTINDSITVYWQTDSNLIKDSITANKSELSKMVLAVDLIEGEQAGIITEEVEVGKDKILISLVK